MGFTPSLEACLESLVTDDINDDICVLPWLNGFFCHGAVEVFLSCSFSYKRSVCVGHGGPAWVTNLLTVLKTHCFGQALGPCWNQGPHSVLCYQYITWCCWYYVPLWMLLFLLLLFLNISANHCPPPTPRVATPCLNSNLIILHHPSFSNC